VRPYRRRGHATYEVDVRWRGYPRLRLACGTTSKPRATAMSRTLAALRDAGRRDLLGLLAQHRLRLADVHDAFLCDPGALEHLKAKAVSPRLGELVERWLAWVASPAGVSPRTRRKYSEKTCRQYEGSWNGFFSVLEHGRDARLTDLSRGFVLDYRRLRARATGGKRRKEVLGVSVSAATLNRDFAALGAFLTWLRDVEGVTVERPPLPRERESSGRERWLSAEELAAFQGACPHDWWPFFATLFYTGARLGEAQGLRGADVSVSARRISIHEADRRLKTKEAVRDLPIAGPLERALAQHLARLRPGPHDLVFAGEFQRYGVIRQVWDATCAAANISGARPHDARHTFAVHAAQAGVPIVRMQKLLGHATATMTLRYMKHAPEAFLDEDAANVAAHLGGAKNAEAEARVRAARHALKQA